jgi:general secretion pathway protein A
LEKMMYSQHYGLSAPPFQLTPDPRFWFDSRTHKRAMAYLGYGLAQGEGFVVITGEIGAGKTTLVAHLMAKIDRARLNAVQIVSTQVEGDDVLRLVAQGLGLATEGVAKAQLLDRVEQRLEQEYRSGKRTLVIVDEAQNLPVSALEELRMLSNFQLAGRALVQIVLLAQPEFRDRIAGAGLDQLRQRVIATHHLTAMGADEIEDYVRHRLNVVGWSGSPAFEPGVFEALHDATGGVPRRLNQWLNRLMLHGAVEGLDLIGADAVAVVADDMGFDSPAEAAAPSAASEGRVETVAAAADEPMIPTPVAPPAAEPAQVLPMRPQPVVVEMIPPTSSTAKEPEAAPLRVDPTILTRLAALEGRIEDQEATLRRVLTLLIDYIERDEAAPPPRRVSAA